jgi:hypothetical protein
MEGGMAVSWLILIPVGLLIIGGAFALIYWWVGRSDNDDGKPT